ncbi:hypothetical protein [Sulfolobus ellipsoid virus 1]|uniref:Uncharacterized protein n=1 Tax=Sulfolobus ellipsoid virus 1 TaxID=2056194 RepID=A0A2H4RBP0_9VIRU|nr:hypothetical protein FGG62_gp13 [Sulfolobus ellipsoid virus 1]ATY46492.1 hypothetical protein [Sulfolobus ellipsoid virus 1]
MDLSKINVRKDIDTKELMYIHSQILSYFDYWKTIIDKIPDTKPIVKSKAFKDLIDRLIDYTSDFYDHYTETLKVEQSYLDEQGKLLTSILVNYLPPYIGDPIAVFERQRQMERPTTLYDAISEMIVRLLRLNISPDTVRSLLENLFKKQGEQK